MLPKVATHILHSTTRAVSSIKPIRNVLHQQSGPGLAPWNNPGSSSGSARYSAAARAVTPGSPAFPAHDPALLQLDDQDDVPPRPQAPARIRSSSLSVPARPSVLRSVQLHARARHAFAAPPDTDAAPDASTQVSHAAKRLLDARHSGNAVRAAEAVREFRRTVVKPSVREFNAALEALQATRRPGEPLKLMLETYNDMLRHSLLPNVATYTALIDSLTARDNEVHSAITALERRIAHRALTAVVQPAFDNADRKRIDMLRRENNFATAMSLFETVLSIGANSKLQPHTYISLLRSCALNSNTDAAIHVWAQFEKRDIFPTPPMFLEMIRVYTNANQLTGAEEIFAEYKSALHRGAVHVSWSQDSPSNPHRLNLFVWNQMIETYFRFNRPDKAVALVEQMLQANPASLQHHVVPDPSPVSSATFTTVLTGFCHIGDVPTAVVWFDRLLAQQSSSSQDPFEPVGVPMKPDNVAWDVLIDALAIKRMIPDLNRLFSLRLSQNPLYIRVPQRLVVYSANMATLPSLDNDQFIRTLAWLLTDVVNSSAFKIKQRLALTADISTAYIERKMYDKALGLLAAYVSDFVKSTEDNVGFGLPPPLSDVQELQLKFTDNLYYVSKGDLPYQLTMILARLASDLHITQPPSLIPFYLQSYALSRASDNLPLQEMSLRDWELVLMAANSFDNLPNSHPAIPDFAYQGLPSIIRDLATFQVDFQSMNKYLVQQVTAKLHKSLGLDGTTALFKETGFIVSNDLEQYLAVLNKDSSSEADSGYASDASIKIDSTLSTLIIVNYKSVSTDKSNDVASFVFTEFQRGVEAGKYPHPYALSLLIQWLGRLGRLEDMTHVYTIAQRVLEAFEDDKVEQTKGWHDIENAMLIGLAHNGEMESAHEYRRRIFENGGVPSAEAYANLILNVKETTDDASNALELFQESQAYHVVPTPYLYNTIISKLSKARKADDALELFRQMKENRVAPSSVTFGTVIGACARVGDVHSAEALFVEMTQDPYFKPRVPPYNTMMQLYTTTKPDRARALYFFDEMRKAKLVPTAYTYKLLIDAYGAVEPVDLERMEGVFQKLLKSGEAVQGTHYASLINAYGCVSKNLDKAIQIFHDMKITRDAIVYEAMFNVFTVHRRADLVGQYLNKMHLEGVHMTAYIANCLIKSYSLLDNIEEARKLFESLEDPPEGVAAPNNRPPHSPLEAQKIDPDTPVYREPSTWEAMIRAELGSGNRDGALALLERLKARQVLL